MSDNNVKQVSLPAILGALTKDVTLPDLKIAEQALQKAFGDSYSLAVEFDRGLKYGDGKIQASALFRSEGGTPMSTQVVISQDGLIQNSAADFSANVSPLFARHFISMLFGAEELIGGTRSKEKERDYNLKASELIWRWAVQLRESVRGAASGDPDEIQEIMNRYYLAREFEIPGDSVNEAWMRVKWARQMIAEVRAYVAAHEVHGNSNVTRGDDDNCRSAACYREDMKMQREMDKASGVKHSNSDKEPICHGKWCP